MFSTGSADGHDGEVAMHKLLKVPGRYHDPSAPGLPRSLGMRVVQSPLVAVGTLDTSGQPWTTLWGGNRGFASVIAEGAIGMASAVDLAHDPVAEAFWSGSSESTVQPNGGRGEMMSALAIDLETRDRVKLMGLMVACSKGVDEKVQMAMVVQQSLGNCPKYLNKKRVVEHSLAPVLVSESLPLCAEAVDLLYTADLFFMSSTSGDSMDTNIRGGQPGLLRILRNDETGVELIYPEYSGNRLYQTLGNIKTNPLVGIVVPDFKTSNVLYLTGSATILIGNEASSLLLRANLALKIRVTAARFVKAGLPFRADVIDYSPYNPPVRVLLSEQNAHTPSSQSGRPQPALTATLVDRTVLTPTISRFAFTLSSLDTKLPSWRAGHHITLDFEPELGMGYSHMRDDDPQSLNDDLKRTFTISNPPGSERVEITVRKHGPATALLWKHLLRIPLELPVLGIDGNRAFGLPFDEAVSSGPKSIFIAAGVGITPLLAQASAVFASKQELEVLWSLRTGDIALAEDSFRKCSPLKAVARLFLTGAGGNEEKVSEMLEMGAMVERRRMSAEDVIAQKGKGYKFFLCTSPGMRNEVSRWLDGEEVVWEDFGY